MNSGSGPPQGPGASKVGEQHRTAQSCWPAEHDPNEVRREGAPLRATATSSGGTVGPQPFGGQQVGDLAVVPARAGGCPLALLAMADPSGMVDSEDPGTIPGYGHIAGVTPFY